MTSVVLPSEAVSEEVIASSDAIVIAANTDVDTQRFVGKKSTKRQSLSAQQTQKRF